MVANSIQNSQLAKFNPRQVLTAQALAPLNQRSDTLGAIRLTLHLAILGVSGYLWMQLSGWMAVLALVVYGASLAFMFCAVHECVHRTAFADKRMNDAIAWLAGLLSFYNSTFYRRYHKWHHRYTRVAGKDPEMDDPEPKTSAQYLWHLSGIPWWVGKFKGHFKVATGQLDDCYFLPESAHAEVIRSTRLQLATYAAIILLSIAVGHPLFLFTAWMLPLAIGQPFLRFVLLAEHTGCSYGDDLLTNTRTTYTLWPLRLLMWNMPYHAEHHLYPSIPFHALPAAHQQLKDSFSHIDSGYLQVNRNILATLTPSALENGIS
ncbi:MAG: fatty acid desaturase family protein [Phormidesmis sp.]